MSLRDKFTDEEWNAIPPFTGFHHNKLKEEIMEKAAQAIKDRCDNLIFDNLVITNTTKQSYDGIEPNPNPYYLDEMVTLGLTNEQFKSAWNATKPILNKSYDADKKPLTHEDEVNPFGKVNLWDFEPLTKTGIKFDYPEINKDIAEAFDLVAEKFKNENTIQMNIEKKKIITQQIFDKVKIEKAEGRTPRIILMSVNDYDIFHDPNNNEYKYYFEDESLKKNKSGVYHSGFAMITHKCFTVEDGEIEVY